MKIKAQIKEICCGEQKLRARANLLLDDSFLVRDIRIVQGKSGLFIAFPARRVDDRFVDVCYPMNNDLRDDIRNMVIEEYEKALIRRESKS